MEYFVTVHDALVAWLAQGLWVLPWWGKVVFTLVVTHITIASVTIFLHRCQAHSALTLSPLVSHFFRLWLWLTTGMVTKEWVAIHRKHHAKCETADDPHSPQTRGIKTVLLTGSELYRAEAKTMRVRLYIPKDGSVPVLKEGEDPSEFGHFGRNTPDDWIERNLYTRYSWQGVGLMLIINVLLFGAIGLAVWAVQMLWIPITAAGIINGIGHYWGYRNFEPPDASTNISPWGIIIGGEELHNNHHTYPTSAKLSVKPWEFDIGWAYIRVMEVFGLAKVKKTPPRLELGAAKIVADDETLKAIVANRFEVMARYGVLLKGVVLEEIRILRSRGIRGARLRNMKFVRKWVHRDVAIVPPGVAKRLESVVATDYQLTTLITMRERLRQLWIRKDVSAQVLTQSLKSWCEEAERSGITALREYSSMLRGVR